jgi:hypothetical protein
LGSLATGADPRRTKGKRQAEAVAEVVNDPSNLVICEFGIGEICASAVVVFDPLTSPPSPPLSDEGGDQSVYLDSFMTEEVPESENEKNKVSTLYLKCDFSLPVMVPLLEMGRSFPVLVNCVFGYLHLHFFSPWEKRFI